VLLNCTYRAVEDSSARARHCVAGTAAQAALAHGQR
jgi:hypothetical protein